MTTVDRATPRMPRCEIIHQTQNCDLASSRQAGLRYGRAGLRYGRAGLR